MAKRKWTPEYCTCMCFLVAREFPLDVGTRIKEFLHMSIVRSVADVG